MKSPGLGRGFLFVRVLELVDWRGRGTDTGRGTFACRRVETRSCPFVTRALVENSRLSSNLRGSRRERVLARVELASFSGEEAFGLSLAGQLKPKLSSIYTEIWMPQTI